jgi:hypothetical protein
LIYRLCTNKNLYYEDGSSMVRTATVIIVVSLLLFRARPIGFLFFLSILALFVGIFSLLVGVNTKRKAKLFHRYALVVENMGSAPVDEIAAAMGVTGAEAESDLIKMVERGYFAKAYVNRKTREFIVMRADGRGAGRRTARQKRLICESCGAANTVTVGQAASCIYCDSPLETG